jgi:hypothetical protein
MAQLERNVPVIGLLRKNRTKMAVDLVGTTTHVTMLRRSVALIFDDGLRASSEVAYVNRKLSFAAMQIVLQRLCGWFEFVTIPELLKLGRPCRRNWCVQADRQWMAQFGREYADVQQA